MNEVHFLGIFSTKCRRLKGEMIMASEKDIENLMTSLKRMGQGINGG